MQKKRRLSGCLWLSVRGCCPITLIVELLVRKKWKILYHAVVLVF